MPPELQDLIANDSLMKKTGFPAEFEGNRMAIEMGRTAWKQRLFKGMNVHSRVFGR